MMPVGPARARELIDRLESEILEPPGALDAPPDGLDPADQTSRVPGSPEPPD